MNINTALAAYTTDYSSQQGKVTHAEVAAGKTGNTANPVVIADKSIRISQAGQDFLTKGQEIMSRYSIEHSSPRDMANMSQELYDSGVISKSDHAMLSFQPELNGEQYRQLFGKEPQPDTSRDFLAEWKEKLDTQRTSGAPKAFADRTVQMIHLLGNLQSLAENSLLSDE